MSEAKKPASLGERLLKLREILISQDWKDDGVFRIPSRPDGGYTYLSAEKTKRNFNRALVDAEVNMTVEYSELQKFEAIGNMSQHWTVKCTMTLYAEAECAKYVAYGEAGDSGDKGINKAQTDAIKQIIFNQFLVADCSDPDANTDDIEVPSVGRAIPKTPAQRQAVKEKLAESQVRPAEKKTEERPATEEKPAEAPAESAPVGPPANTIQKRAIDAIVAKARKDAEDGILTASEVDALDVEAHKAVESSMLASRFIMAHRRA